MSDIAMFTGSQRPYCLIGAGRLVASVWKRGHRLRGWAYYFTLFRMQASTGRVKQVFQPADVRDFVKLCQVLAATLAEDGCLPPSERRTLQRLAEQLDPITRPWEKK